ncbi:MAG: carbon monoxide dehydrogenase [Marmoricola sp.]|nr:carbon monoxide dehydrogenase [Marmoricola sp.]
MDLRHEFTVPATIEETWQAFNDIESVAGCFPGATVTSVEGDTFQGSCKVKLGPIALVYNGSGTFLEKDEATHVFKIEAKGKDKRGNGTAGALVTATLTEAGAETAVQVLTDLNITGKPAQFGRGVMQDVSDKLLDQFVACLKTKVGAPQPVAEPIAEPEPEAVVAQAPVSGEAEAAPRHAAPAEQPAPRVQTQPPPAADDALDLGATVIPVLLKAYGKQIAGVLGVLALIALARRFHRR